MWKHSGSFRGGVNDGECGYSGCRSWERGGYIVRDLGEVVDRREGRRGRERSREERVSFPGGMCANM